MAQTGAVESLVFPIDLAVGASPGLQNEGVAKPFAEASVEFRIVSDDEVRLADEGGDLVEVDRLSRHHRVVDTGEHRYGRRDRVARIPKRLVGFTDRAKPPIHRIIEREHT